MPWLAGGNVSTPGCLSESHRACMGSWWPHHGVVTTWESRERHLGPNPQQRRTFVPCPLLVLTAGHEFAHEGAEGYMRLHTGGCLKVRQRSPACQPDMGHHTPTPSCSGLCRRQCPSGQRRSPEAKLGSPCPPSSFDACCLLVHPLHCSPQLLH